MKNKDEQAAPAAPVQDESAAQAAKIAAARERLNAGTVKLEKANFEFWKLNEPEFGPFLGIYLHPGPDMPSPLPNAENPTYPTFVCEHYANKDEKGNPAVYMIPGYGSIRDYFATKVPGDIVEIKFVGQRETKNKIRYNHYEFGVESL